MESVAVKADNKIVMQYDEYKFLINTIKHFVWYPIKRLGTNCGWRLGAERP